MGKGTVTDRIAARDVAAYLRAQFKVVFPGVKFSVRSKGSSWIDVEWVDGPTEEGVKEVTRPVRGGHQDPYSKNYVSAAPVTIVVRGVSITGDPVIGGFHYRRNFSDAVREAALKKWMEVHPGMDMEEAAYRWHDSVAVGKVVIRNGNLDGQVEQIAKLVILPALAADK